MELKFKSHIGCLQHLVGMHYVFIPSSVVKQSGGSLSKRVIITINNNVSWQGGFMALSEGNAYISINKKRMKDAGVGLDSEVDVLLTEDNSQYGTEMPEELFAVLQQDPEGNQRFEQLKPAMQRYVINYVKTVKSPEKRIERALLLIGNLKLLPIGKEEFRSMLGLPPREL